MSRRISLFLLFFLLILPGSSQAVTSPRLALVIGNADYDHAVFPALSNPIHDARDVAQVLEEFCFEVILEENADRETMLAAIEKFGRRLAENGGLGLFYYSGHGVQYQQQHYLIPLRSALYEEAELPGKAIEVDAIIHQMEMAGNAPNILIFDTCRETFTRESLEHAGKDLVTMEGPRGSLIVFSSSLGQSAFGDSAARNSLYTKHLVQALQEDAGRDLLDIFRTINRRVTEEAIFYRLNSQSWQFLHKKGLPGELLQQLQQPQLSQMDFTEQQFERFLHDLLSPIQYERYTPLIRSAAEQSQSPWLYTNITERIILNESCSLAPGNRPPLDVEILSDLKSDEIFLSSDNSPIHLMALLNVDADDVRYRWSLNSDFGQLEGDTTASHVRYVPPERIEADMTAVSIQLTVRQGSEEVWQEKRLTLLAERNPAGLSSPSESFMTPPSSNAWQWAAGLGTLGGAVVTATIMTNSRSNSTQNSFTGRFYAEHVGELFVFSSDPSASPLLLNGATWMELVEGKSGRIYGLRQKNIVLESSSCEPLVESSLQGSVNQDNSIQLSWPQITGSFSCGNAEINYFDPEGGSVYRLIDNGNTLLGESGADLSIEFQRIE